MNLWPWHWHQRIGIDRFLRLEWLDRTVDLILAGNGESEVKTYLVNELHAAFRGNEIKPRGSLDKTITILMKIWVRPPRHLHPLQREGLKLISHLPRENRIALHWGMTMAVYPFWGNVATHVGRLLSLQGRVSQAQVRRRIVEQYGQRPTVKYAVCRVLRSMVDWRVLRDAQIDGTGRKDGTYVPGSSFAITHVKLIAWLLEAFLRSHPSGSMALDMVLNSPTLFPFRLIPVSVVHLVEVSGQLDVLRHGLDQEIILLRSHL